MTLHKYSGLERPVAEKAAIKKKIKKKNAEHPPLHQTFFFFFFFFGGGGVTFSTPCQKYYTFVERVN